MALHFADEASFTAWQQKTLPTPETPQERTVREGAAQQNAPQWPTLAPYTPQHRSEPPAWHQQMEQCLVRLAGVRRLCWAVLLLHALGGLTLLAILGRLP